MINYEKTFADFTGRDDDLQRVTRYDPYLTMFYRSNDLIHSHRVHWIMKELEPFAIKAFGKDYDPLKAELIALIHDDAEIKLGDYSSSEKAKMTTTMASAHHAAELEAIDAVAQRFPTQLGRYNYKALLIDDIERKSLEAQVLQLADKFDAIGEALHELFDGNRAFNTPLTSWFGRVDLPHEHYIKLFRAYPKSYPRMKQFLSHVSQFAPTEDINAEKIVSNGKPHTAESIQNSTGFDPYDLWIQINLKYASPDQLRLLYTKVEG